MNWWKLEREARRPLPLYSSTFYTSSSVRACVLLLCVLGKKLWWSRATIFMPLIMFYIPFKCPGIQLCHTAAVSRCLAATEIHFVWHRRAVAGGKVNRGHFKWPVLWLATLKGWGWPVATQLARWLASILKEANGDEESPPKAALKLHMTRRRRKGSGHEN